MSERCSMYIGTELSLWSHKEDWERIRITFLLWFHIKFMSPQIIPWATCDPTTCFEKCWLSPIQFTQHCEVPIFAMVGGPPKHLLCARPCVRIRAWRWVSPGPCLGGLQSMGKADHSLGILCWMMSSGVHHFAWKHVYHEKITVTGRGSSLVVQWLVLRAFSALGSIVGQGTKISTSSTPPKKNAGGVGLWRKSSPSLGRSLWEFRMCFPKWGLHKGSWKGRLRWHLDEHFSFYSFSS